MIAAFYLMLIVCGIVVEALWVLNPFILKGKHLRSCWSCGGWGSEPGGHCCNVCFGQGFKLGLRPRLMSFQ
jgi:hypothetical protein